MTSSCSLEVFLRQTGEQSPLYRSPKKTIKMLQHRGCCGTKLRGDRVLLTRPTDHGSLLGGFCCSRPSSIYVYTCSLNFKVKVGTGAVVITGGQDETFTVRDTVIEYSNIDQVVRQIVATYQSGVCRIFTQYGIVCPNIASDSNSHCTDSKYLYQLLRSPRLIKSVQLPS